MGWYYWRCRCPIWTFLKSVAARSGTPSESIARSIAEVGLHRNPSAAQTGRSGVPSEPIGRPKRFAISLWCPKTLPVCHTQLLPDVSISPPPQFPRFQPPLAVSQSMGTTIFWYGNSPDIWPSSRGRPKPTGTQRQLQTILENFWCNYWFFTSDLHTNFLQNFLWPEIVLAIGLNVNTKLTPPMPYMGK